MPNSINDNVVNRCSSVKNGIIDLYESRSILKSLIIKDLFGDYRNSFLGFGWHFVMPLVMMAVFYLAFSVGSSSSLPDFWIYICAAIFPFNFMLSMLTDGSGTVVNNSDMIKKMYFPRDIIVIAKVISSFIITILGYILVLGIIVAYGHPLHIKPLLFLPIILVLMAIFSLGCALFFSSLTVYIRDVQYLLKSTSIVFFFITPMYFVADRVTGVFRGVIDYNPLTYYTGACQSIIYYGEMPASNILIVCTMLAVISILIGYLVFNRLKSGFAERL